MKTQGWEFTIDLTFLEIYNETVQVPDHAAQTRLNNTQLIKKKPRYIQKNVPFEEDS